MVIEIADRHCAKSRFRFVSWTPGRIAIKPNTSRPFVWMFVRSSSVSVVLRELSTVWTGVTSEVTETVSLIAPICSVSLPRSRVSAADRLMSATASALKPGSSTFSE